MWITRGLNVHYRLQVELLPGNSSFPFAWGWCGQWSSILYPWDQLWIWELQWTLWKRLDREHQQELYDFPLWWGRNCQLYHVWGRTQSEFKTRNNSQNQPTISTPFPSSIFQLVGIAERAQWNKPQISSALSCNIADYKYHRWSFGSWRRSPARHNNHQFKTGETSHISKCNIHWL